MQRRLAKMIYRVHLDGNDRQDSSQVFLMLQRHFLMNVLGINHTFQLPFAHLRFMFHQNLNDIVVGFL